MFCLQLQGGSEVHIHWKGAAEIVLASCTGWLDENGSIQPMTPNQVRFPVRKPLFCNFCFKRFPETVVSLQMDEFKKFIEDMAAGSLRCIAFAYRLYDLEKVPREEDRINWTLPENDLILLGIVGIKVNYLTATDVC